MRILFIGVNPKDTGQLRLQDEINVIKDIVDPTNNRLYVRNASTKRAMRRYLNKYKPNVLHISGHGNDDQTLLFEDENGHTEIVYIDQLGTFLDHYSKYLKCVVLSACYSLNNVEIFSSKIHCVIGMKMAVANTMAIDFSRAFYDSLCSGETFESAFGIAKAELNLSSAEDHDVLKIIVNKNIDSVPPDLPKIKWVIVGFVLATIVVLGYLLYS
ncbi:CHAT domain-containing protein [uncultured Psychroserpens sp.]|uniref:CHAT domain-containing protein n=1 Tax=uncultured Psychroserpens sp. TaxID=255436 RepID=UPI002626808C|nr:CHAT domain-containing protein [uncultured Psychroserpens sp.]